MPKAKLKFPKGTQKKLAVAAEFSNVKLGKALEVGDTLIVECQANDMQSFLDMDRLRLTVSGSELDAPAAPAADGKAKK